MKRSFEFSHALTRAPGDSVVRGLRDPATAAQNPDEPADPDVDVFRQQHTAYVTQLRDLGLTVDILPADEDYPDSVFVEDPALAFGDIAVLLRPGAPSRAGEAAALKPELESRFKQVLDLPGKGSIDGGDVLVTEDIIFVGLSARTTSDGLKALSELMTPYGYTVREVITPSTILHFKTACGLLDDHTIFTTPELSDTGCFDGFDIIKTVPGEEAAANLIRVNDLVLVPADFPNTARRLEGYGYRIKTVDISEAARLDGGLSCMSLRYNLEYSPSA